ncbi:MAG: hypothetical protein JNL61_02645 [Rhizobiaceae bacterium]|nr:hypothetical protein [Rhizobiaceae bacterium]
MASQQFYEWDIERSGLRSLSSPEIKRFWDRYVEFRAPVEIARGSLWSRWRHVSDDLVISLYITNRSVGVFVRGQRGEGYRTTLTRLSAYEPRLGKALDARLDGHPGCCYLSNHTMSVTDPVCWPSAFAWLAASEEKYHRVLGRIVKA